MNKPIMVIVGVVAPPYSDDESLRVYYIDKGKIKDIKDADLAPYAEQLNVVNFNDLQIPEVRELYPHIRTGNKPYYVSGHDACYVLGTFGDGGYVCIRPHLANDFLQVIPRSRLVNDVKRGKLYLLNAVIEQGSVSDTVSPITGEWQDMSHLKGRTLKDAEDTACDCGEDDCTCGTTVDARDKIGAGETVDSHDELGMLNATQKEFLKNYYIDYSVETFNKLVGKSSWKLKEDHEIVEKNKKRRESKLAKLAELRTLSDGADWRFAGLWDVGYVSSKPEHLCEFGHKLRYIYMACPVNKPMAQARKEGTLLRFGIKCHSDFLNIPAEEVSRLGKLLNTMSSEITFISMVVANKALGKHDALMASMHDLLGRLQSNNKLVEVLGERLATAYVGFTSNKLPLVESFVLDVLAKFKEYGYLKVLSAAGVDTSVFAPQGTDAYSLPTLSPTADRWDRQNYPSSVKYAHESGLSRLSKAHDPIPVVLTTYAEMLLSNDIAGEYMYNPNATLTDFVKGKSTTYQRFGADEIVPDYPEAMRKYKIGYNNETRELRTMWLRYFTQNTFREDFLTAISGAQVKALTLGGLEAILALYKRLEKTGQNLKAVLGDKYLNSLVQDMVDARLYGYRSSGKYDDIYPEVLLTSLPYIITSASNVQARRAASYKLGKDGYADLSARLDEVKEGTNPDYIAKIKAKFAVEEAKVEEKPVQPQSAPQPAPQPAQQTVQQSAPQTAQSVQKPAQQATSQKSEKTTQQQRVSAGSSKSKTSKFRGDAAEAKKKADEFMALYDSLPKVLTNEPGIQIALAIIKRFRDTFKEKEGFTYRENWRVTQEIETLKRLKANT